MIAQCNEDFDAKKIQSSQGLSWTGPYTVLYDGKNSKITNKLN